MTVTLTASYQEFLAADTVSKIDELLDESYDLEAMLTFIDEYNETQFVTFYEEYVRCGEAIGYEAVDALIAENGEMSCIEGCDDRYRGMYDSVADFAEQTCDDMGYSVPDFVVVDWEATWDTSLRYDFTACNAGYREVYIFSDY